MTWQEQAESVMKVWTEAQRTMWQGWYDAVQATSTPAMFNPGIVEEWRKMAAQGMEMWTSNAEPMFKNVSGQLLASQTAMLQMLQFTANAWQSMAPKLEAGQDWSSVLSNYVEQMRQQMTMSAQDMTNTVQDSSQLWQMYMQRMQTMGQPWLNFSQQAPNLFSGAMAGGNGSLGNWTELTSLGWDAFGKTFGSMTLSPSFGLTRELEEKVAKGFAAWQEMQQASADYQLLMNNAWAGVFSGVLQEMKDRAEQDKPIESVRDLMRLWIDAADRSFDDLFRDDTYAKVQGRFVTATMKYRIEEQKVFDEMMKYGYIATRSEIDEANRRVYELRREVRALRKALNEKSSGGSSRSRSKKAAEQPAETVAE